MLAIPILLFCCYGLYSSMSTGVVPSQSKAVCAETRIIEKASPQKKQLIGNRVKDLCTNFFASRKNKKKGEVVTVERNTKYARHNSRSDHNKSVTIKPPLAAASYSSLKPTHPKITFHSDSYLRRSDEYLLSKYDIARLHKGDELIKWQSIKLASCKKDSIRYKTYVEKLHARRLSDNISDKIRNASEVVVSLDEKYSFLTKEESYTARQLRHVNNVDLSSGIKHLRFLDDLLRKVPVLIPQNLAIITSHFGKRKLLKRKARDHKGIDMTSPEALIYAAADGRVEFCGWSNGLGNLVVINHGKFTTKYAHLRKICVVQGSFVTQGSKIAFEGATGAARGRHLHFEVRCFSGEAVNPMEFIACSMQESQKSHSANVLALQQSRYNKSVLLAEAAYRRQINGDYLVGTNVSNRRPSSRGIILAQNEAKQPLARKKATVRRKLAPSKHSSKSCVKEKADKIGVNDLQSASIKPEENKKSFFGKMYRAIVSW